MTAFTKYKPRELLLFWIAFWITRLLQQLQTARTFTWASKPWLERNERRRNRCHATRPFRTWDISKLKPFVLGLLVPFISIYLVSTHGSAEFQTSELKLHRIPGAPPEDLNPPDSTSGCAPQWAQLPPEWTIELALEYNVNTTHNRKVVIDGRTLGTYRSTWESWSNLQKLREVDLILDQKDR